MSKRNAEGSQYSLKKKTCSRCSRGGERALSLMDVFTASLTDRLMCLNKAKSESSQLSSNGFSDWKCVVHLYSSMWLASEALSASHLCSAPSQGHMWQCRLGYEHNKPRLLSLPPYAGTQPIRPTYTPFTETSIHSHEQSIEHWRLRLLSIGG